MLVEVISPQPNSHIIQNHRCRFLIPISPRFSPKVQRTPNSNQEQKGTTGSGGSPAPSSVGCDEEQEEPPAPGALVLVLASTSRFSAAVKASTSAPECRFSSCAIRNKRKGTVPIKSPDFNP